MVDPRHPLYGRSFRVLERQTGCRRARRDGGFLLVTRNGEDANRIPAAAVAPQSVSSLASTKLTLEAIAELVDEATRSGIWK